MPFDPDYRNVLDAVQNRRPKRLPLYEHIISPAIMERILGVDFAVLEQGDESDLKQFFRHFCKFFKEMTYDTVSYEISIISILPAEGASIGGARPGPIQSRADFEAMDWDGLVKKYIDKADKKFAAMGKTLPTGMKAIGGVANGAFEISEDLVGLEHLAYMQVDDPELFASLFKKIGKLMTDIWIWFLQTHARHYAVCRFGDDLGYKSGTLTSPRVIREHILPQYQQVIQKIHAAGYPFLWHSCGCIFDIMEDAIATGIDAKHSNEDAIAPFEKWIELYGDRIGLFGGIDVDLLCRKEPGEIFKIVAEKGTKYRQMAKGYALGSGNSIPDYVPLDGYLAMIRAAHEIRRREKQS